jgi:hypothetical protein
MLHKLGGQPGYNSRLYPQPAPQQFTE